MPFCEKKIWNALSSLRKVYEIADEVTINRTDIISLRASVDSHVPVEFYIFTRDKNSIDARDLDKNSFRPLKTIATRLLDFDPAKFPEFWKSIRNWRFTSEKKTKEKEI